MDNARDMAPTKTSPITKALSRAGHTWVGAYALSTAFVTYFCMYAFRRPFAAATYDDISGWDWTLNFKIALVLSQAVGYAASKFIGVKFVPEADAHRRPRLIILLILGALASLTLFAVVPPPLKIVAIFLSGLPLGMIWGLVFGYLEGRRLTEILGTGLCISFIVSSGAVKSVGSMLMVDCGVPEMWMPAITGALFFPLLALSVWLLAQTPPPDEKDQAERMKRSPMFKAERKAFIAKTGLGLLFLIVAYVFLTAARNFRDMFAVEIWNTLGFTDEPGIFTLSELPIALIVIVLFSFAMLVRDNKRAVLVNHWLIVGGGIVVAATTYAFQIGQMGPVWWMILVGAGIYISYIPYNVVLVDRMTAAVAIPGNAAFFMYLADSSGYAGNVVMLMYKNFREVHLSWLNFFIGFCYVAAAVTIITTLLSYLYFRFFVFSSVECVGNNEQLIATNASDA